MGIVFTLLVILICRQSMSDAAFTDWGWRIPFLLSAILVLLSGHIRLKLEESPLYARLREEGKASTNPIKDTYISGRNWGLMAIALFGATAPEGVVWYTGQFYALIYLTAVLKLNYVTLYIIMMVADDRVARLYLFWLVIRPHWSPQHHDDGIRARGNHLLAGLYLVQHL